MKLIKHEKKENKVIHTVELDTGFYVDVTYDPIEKVVSIVDREDGGIVYDKGMKQSLSIPVDVEAIISFVSLHIQDCRRV